MRVFGVGCLDVSNLWEVYCEGSMVSVIWGVGSGVGVKVCVVRGCGWLSWEPVINRCFFPVYRYRCLSVWCV